MKKTINVKFNFGDSVVLKTDPSTPRLISGIMIRPMPNRGVFVTYGLARGEGESWHNDCEIMNLGRTFKIKGYMG